MGDVEAIEFDSELHGWKRVPRFFGLYWRTVMTICVPFVFLPVITQNNTAMFRCLYLICVMGTYWVTECLPVQITAFIPLIFFPFMGIMPTEAVSVQYMKTANFMFIGGIAMANAIEYSMLHIRIAYFSVTKVGCNLRKLNFVLMIITMVVSMWIPNTAACAMMCPIAKAILTEFENLGMLRVFHPPKSESELPEPTDITICFYFSLAFASTIGGCATLIGTPTNLTFKQIYESRFEVAPTVDFLHFMLFSAPVSIIATVLTFFWMQFYHMGLFRPKSEAHNLLDITPEVKAAVVETVKTKYNELGKLTSHEIWVGCVFAGTILAICSKTPGFAKGWGDLFPKPIGETSVCILGVFLLFVIPSKWYCFRFFKKNEPVPTRPAKTLLIWPVTHTKTPWFLLLLLGSGFALAEGAKVSGVSQWLGDKLKGLNALPNVIVVFIVGIASEFFTNFTANVAVGNIILPVASELALAIHVHPMYLMMPAALGCSFAFCLPVGTPPNAIVAGLINSRTSQMIVSGIGPSVISLVLYIAAFPTYGALIYPQFQSYPDWAKNETLK